MDLTRRRWPAVGGAAPAVAPRRLAGRRRVALAIAVLTFAAVALLHVHILMFLGRFLVVEESVTRADAIAVLLGSPDRTLEAIELYRAGYARVLILTKGEPPRGHAEFREAGVSLPEPHELNVRAAVALGIPEEAIALLPERASSTHEEILQIGKFVNLHGLNSVIVVTSPWHTRRTRVILREALGGRVTYAVRATRFDSFDPRDWWRSRQDTWSVVSEYEKLVYHYVAGLAKRFRFS